MRPTIGSRRLDPGFWNGAASFPGFSCQMNRAYTYFTDLGFLGSREQIELGPTVTQLRLLWTAGVYVLSSLGIFCRHYIDLPHLRLQAPFSASVLAASFIVGLALLPLPMKWFNSKRAKPNWEHVLFAFSFGFFIHLASTGLGGQVISALKR